MFKKRMTRRQLLQALTARAQHARKVFEGCLESQGLNRSSDYALWADGTRLAYSQQSACLLMLSTALTGDTEAMLPDGSAEALVEGMLTVPELLERYR